MKQVDSFVSDISNYQTSASILQKQIEEFTKEIG
jgi:hypothetical protein